MLKSHAQKELTAAGGLKDERTSEEKPGKTSRRAENKKKKFLKKQRTANKRLNRGRWKAWKAWKGKGKHFAARHRGAASVHWRECVCVSLLERGRHQRGQRLLGALHRGSRGGFALMKKKTEDGGAEAADNKLDIVNNTNHPPNRGSNKTAVNRTARSK